MATEMNSPQSQSGSKIIRLIRPSVVVLCGPAACGKSTFAAKHFRPTQIISSDQARALVCDDERDQRFQTQAFALLHFLVEQRLSINRLCVVDSTALTAAARKSLLELARRFHVPAVVLVFDVPLETCLERDAERERTVGQPVIERQYQLFEQTRSAIKQEGFDQVVELSVQDMGNVQTEIVFRPVPRAPAGPAQPERRGFVPRPPQPAATEKGAPAETRAASRPDGAATH
jgi:protein phosphatase